MSVTLRRNLTFAGMALVAASMAHGAQAQVIGGALQDTSTPTVEDVEAARVGGAGPAARFTLGAGLSRTPDYPGADSSSFGPAGTLRFDFLRLPGGLEYGSVGAVGFVEGFGPRGALRYIGSRKASDNAELRGLDDVDASLELGLGLGYDAAYWRAFADLRYGVIGHSSWTGEFGADAILRPSESWVINFGPRAAWGASRYMGSYFGVTDDESESSGLDAYDPSAGFYGVGVELGARYTLSEDWGVEGRANYERLINDAADSPITDIGSVNQFGMQVMITRSISLGF